MKVGVIDWLAASLIAVSAAGCGACTAEVSGELMVDHAEFKVSNCRSGQAFGFSGIELHHEDGRRVRLLSLADGSCDAAWFAPGAETGEIIGPCGTLVMKAQHSRINGITNLEGHATLDCDNNGHAVSGQIRFENCH